jgi:hypothetical protein
VQAGVATEVFTGIVHRNVIDFIIRLEGEPQVGATGTANGNLMVNASFMSGRTTEGQWGGLWEAMAQ